MLFKKTSLKIIAVLSVLVLVFTASFSANAASKSKSKTKTVTITLKVKKGHDIASAFNAATIKAKSYKSNVFYKVVIPKGSYKAGRQLKLWSNTTIEMSGVTIKRTHSGTMIRLGNKSDWDKANKGKGYAGYSGYTHINIHGGVFDGNGYSAAIIRFGHTTNVRMEGTTFKNVKNAHHIEIGACKNFVIKNCTIADFSGSWSAKRNYEALQLEALAGDHFGGYNPNTDETPNKNITIEGCKFVNLQRALGTHTGITNSYFDNMVFKNNTFTNVTGYAIVATNYRNSVISGNRFENCGAGIWFRTMEPGHNNFYASKYTSNSHPKYIKLNCKIQNNVIGVKSGFKAKYRYAAYGIQLYGEVLSKKKGHSPKGDFRVAGVTVSGNKIAMHVTGYPIWVNGAAECSVTNNTVDFNARSKSAGTNCDGIRLDSGQNVTVYKNKITNYTRSNLADSICGITANNSSGCKANNNTITNMKKDGIKLYKSGNSQIKSNVINSSTRDGICVSNLTTVTISGNKVSNCKGHGINVTSSNKVYTEKNTIKNCNRNGINALKKQITGDKKNKISVKGKARSWR